MLKLFSIVCSFIVCIIQSNRLVDCMRYQPTWDSLDSRPLPKWYDEAKIGIFIHWGVYAVPSFGTEWFWRNWKVTKNQQYVDFMKKNYPPGFSYQDFAPQFTAELFDPYQWAELLNASGAKYVVLTSKHHEGYTLWPSKYSFSWNSMDVGPHIDIVGRLAEAVRIKTDLKFGLYHSLLEWFNPLYIEDGNNKWQTDNFVRSKTLPELYELVNTYAPEVIWSDGEWDAPDTYWKSKEFIAWLYNDSPVKDTVVVNDRWGSDTLCKHGDFYTCKDRYNPGALQDHKWENAFTIDSKSWGFRGNANITDYLKEENIIHEIVTSVSCRGNALVNVGPTKEGTIAPIFQERLLNMGEWLAINGEAIYQSTFWKIQNDTATNDVWYTFRPDLKSVYATFFKWPKDGALQLYYDHDLFTENTNIKLLNINPLPVLHWKPVISGNGVEIILPNFAQVDSKWAWTLKISC